MKIMTKDSSATAREPHVNRTTRTATIIDALKRRAQSVLNDESIDARSRSILRDALKTNDPWLAELLRRTDGDESSGEPFDCSQSPKANENSSGEKIEALSEIICRGGDESAGALFVLMGTLQNSTHPEALANTVKHFAFTRCGEFNLFGMVDAQLAAVESELLVDHTLIS
jgi:hypothetical protein